MTAGRNISFHFIRRIIQPQVSARGNNFTMPINSQKTGGRRNHIFIIKPVFAVRSPSHRALRIPHS